MKKLTMLAGLAAMFCICGAAFATETGEVTMIGSDAVSFHGDSTFAGQLEAAQLGTNVAEVSDFGLSGALTAGASVTVYSSLTALESSAAFLAGSYSGVFIASPGTCCDDPSSDPSLAINDPNLLKLRSYVNGGGDVAIENFLGFNGAATAVWGELLGFNPRLGIVNYSGCGADDAHPTAAGASEGFTNTGDLGCFVHQQYNQAYFASFSGINSLMDGGNVSVGFAARPDLSSVLETDGPLSAPSTPEPATLILLGSGLVGVISKKMKKS